MGTLSFIKRIMRRPYARENMSVGYPKLVYSHLFLAEPGTPFPSTLYPSASLLNCDCCCYSLVIS